MRFNALRLGVASLMVCLLAMQPAQAITWSTTITTPPAGSVIGSASGNCAVYGYFKWMDNSRQNPTYPNHVLIRITDSTGQYVDSTGTSNGTPYGGSYQGPPYSGQKEFSGSAAIPATAPAGSAATIKVTGSIFSAGPPPTTTELTSGSTTGVIST